MESWIQDISVAYYLKYFQQYQYFLVIVEKSNFLGKNSLISLFVFSLVHLCYELYGSVKYTLTQPSLKKQNTIKDKWAWVNIENSLTSQFVKLEDILNYKLIQFGIIAF